MPPQLPPQRADIEEALSRSYSLLEPWSLKHRHERAYNAMLARLVSEYAPDPEAVSVVDMGCGVGVLASALAFLGYHVCGIEKYVFSAGDNGMFFVEQSDALRQRLRDHGVDVRTLDLLDPAPHDLHNSFDMAINAAVIEHLKDPRLFLSNCASMVKPGGFIITMTPNIAVFYKRLRFLFGLSPHWELKDFFNRGEHDFVGHWREYTMGELKEMHEWAGFKVVKAVNTDIYDLCAKPSVRTAYNRVIRSISRFIPHSREAHIVVARKI